MTKSIDVAALVSLLGAQAVLSGDSAERYDAAGRPVGAQVLVKPERTEQVSQLLRLCDAREWPVVPFGGLTGLADGEKIDAPCVALSLERMNQIERIDARSGYVRAQAGVILEHLHRALAEAGLMFPLDLGARGSCTLGGNAATNAGGLRVLRYGMMRQLVLGIEVVLPNGQVVERLQPMLKNNAGYDFKHWFIGAEGTLGVITRLTLRAYPQPRSEQCALVAFEDFHAAADFLQHLRGALPSLSAFEIMWDDFYQFMLGALKRRNPLSGQYPYYAVVEYQGSAPEADAERFEQLLGEALERGQIQDAVLASSLKEQKALWAIRDDTSCLYALKPLYSYDVSLDIGDMPQYVESVHRGLQSLWEGAVILSFGHMGDGNLHLAISCGTGDKTEKAQIDQWVYECLRPFDGCVSAEHGIGLAKRQALLDSRGVDELALMWQLKRALDPKNLMNPGKVLPDLP